MNNVKLISDMLKDLGIPANLLGYDYIIQAVELCSQDKSYIRHTMQKLYPAIAISSGTTVSRVERAIRHAIEVGFSRVECEQIEKFFGHSIDSSRGKPTNSEFIAAITEHYIFVSSEVLNNGQP